MIIQKLDLLHLTGHSGAYESNEIKNPDHDTNYRPGSALNARDRGAAMI
ncbi:MAG: hypothetical protein ACLFU1_02940 [Alphaproteobacteria bacterium]